MFPKGDLNRIWVVLGAIDCLDNPTLANITKSVGMPKSSVSDAIKKILSGQVAGVTLEKSGSEYRIKEWSDFRVKVNEIYSQNT